MSEEDSGNDTSEVETESYTNDDETVKKTTVSERLKLHAQVALGLFSSCGLILTVNLGLTASTVNSHILAIIRLPIILSTIFLLISLLFGVIGLGFVMLEIDGPNKRRNQIVYHFSALIQNVAFFLGVGLIGYAVYIRLS